MSARIWLAAAILLATTAVWGAKLPDTQQFEQRVLELTNLERVAHGLQPLRLEPGLTELARRHSENMGMHGFFDHVDQDGLRVWERQRKYYPQLLHSAIGENLHRIESGSYKFQPEDVIAGWMASATHSKNVLEPKYSHAGVGVFIMGHKLYTTMISAAPIMKLSADLPELFRVGQSYQLNCEYLSPQPRANFLCSLEMPDPATRIKVNDTVYFEGSLPLNLEWTDDTHFTLTLDFCGGPGDYSLQIGWGDSYYPDMFTFRAE